MPFPSFFPTGQDRLRGSLPQNWFFAKDDERGPVLLGTPGLTPFVNLGSSIIQVRGMETNVIPGTVPQTRYLYCVGQASHGTSDVFQVDGDANVRNLGSMSTGSGPVWIIPMRNGNQVYFADGVNGYYYDTLPKTWLKATAYLVGIVVRPLTNPTDYWYQCTVAGTSSPTTEPTWPTSLGGTVTDNGITWTAIPAKPYFAKITDPNYLGGGPSVAQDGYIIYAKPQSGQWGVSVLDDCTTYPGSGNAVKGADIVQAILTSHLTIILMGNANNEIWWDSGSSPLPFSKLTGSLIEKPLGAPGTACNGENTFFWVDTNRQVQMAMGYQPIRISTDKIEKELRTYPTITDMIGFFQIQRGHSFYWLISPSAGRTLVADISMMDKNRKAEWHVRSSNQGRHRANCYAYFNDMHLVGDYQSGQIWTLDENNFTENGQPLISKVQSQEYFSPSNPLIKFPDLRLRFADTGDQPINVDAQAILKLSTDGGKTWKNERPQSIGKIGQYKRRCIFRQNGSDEQGLFELMISDPVNRDLIGADWL